MANMSDWLEKNLASHLVGSGTLSKPATLAVALCSTPPTDAHTGATIPEVSNANGYARQTMGPGSTAWTDPVATDGIASNLIAITFPVDTTADWGWISGVAICDASGYGAGNVLFRGTVTTPKLVQVGDQFRFAVGAITLTFA